MANGANLKTQQALMKESYKKGREYASLPNRKAPIKEVLARAGRGAVTGKSRVPLGRQKPPSTQYDREEQEKHFGLKRGAYRK